MKPNPVVHFEMPAKDRQRVSKFYESAFGWGMSIMGPEMGSYVLATTTSTKDGRPETPGAINGGFFDYEDKPGFQYPHVVIAVEDIKASMELVTKSGGKVFGEPMDIPTVGLFVSIEDTEGNRVGILQPSM